MTEQENNKKLVLEAFDAAFNRNEADAFERYWSPIYIQHSPRMAPGREGLIKANVSRPAELHYEPGLIMAEGDYVMVHGRFTMGNKQRAVITLDILRIENGLLAEHWDVMETEVRKEESKSGLPMFKHYFATL